MTRTTRTRWMIWGGLLVLLAVLLGVALRPQPIPVDLGVVARGTVRVTLDHEGMTRVRERFVVSAPVHGRVLRITLEPGDPVEAGRTVVATFLPSAPMPLDARTQAEARARVKAAEAALARARAERAAAEVQADFARTEAERIARLAAEGIVSSQQQNQAEAEARSRHNALLAAESAVQAALHELEAASAALVEPASVQQTRGREQTLTLRAPIDGIVLRRLRESESVVAAGEPLVELANPADLEVIADFLSTDAVRMRPGQRAIVDQWGGSQPLEGRVRRIEPSGFTKISALGVEEQRVWVVIAFADAAAAARALGDGYRVEARVVVAERIDAMTVPTSALFRQGDAWAVFAVENGRARLRPIRVGERNGQVAEVLDGLAVGTQVILHPPDTVGDGTRVTERVAG